MPAQLHWFLMMALSFCVVLGGCGGASGSSASPGDPTLDPANVNLIFVVSEDLANHAAGDIDSATANLTNQGLRRSLAMGSFLRRRVLGNRNVTQIYALEPMTHLQTPSHLPDLVAAETIEQFALLNEITLSSAPPPLFVPFTGHSYPLNVSYAPRSVPNGVATPSAYCGNCRGLDFNDANNNNETLISGIIAAGVPGFYVFSAPWQTTSALMTNIDQLEGYHLDLPMSFRGPNFIFALSIPPAGDASLTTYNANLHPASRYPLLPAPRPRAAPCAAQTPFAISVVGGSGGATIPAGINTDETIYVVRHADAHPLEFWSDGNYICAGQWRALDLPNVLLGKITPDEVYSSDPAQTTPGTEGFSWSGVAPALTVEPYAIANGLPFGLAASFDVTAAQPATDFFFTGDGFTNHKVLLGYSFQFIAPMVNALIAGYFAPAPTPITVPAWPPDDYDTIWTVTLDGSGNLSVNNSMCEGIDSAKLPPTCPRF